MEKASWHQDLQWDDKKVNWKFVILLYKNSIRESDLVQSRPGTLRVCFALLCRRSPQLSLAENTQMPHLKGFPFPEAVREGEGVPVVGGGVVSTYFTPGSSCNCTTRPSVALVT